jgi:hypothetical protein
MSRQICTSGLFGLALALLLALPAQAITGLGIGLKAGVVSDYENPNLKLEDFEFDNLKYFGGFVVWHSPYLAFEVGAEYYWDQVELDILGERREVEARDFFVGVTGKYHFAFPVIKPFLGAGIAAHNFTFEYQGPLGEFEDVTMVVPDDETYLGFHLVVGAKLTAPILPVDIFVEGKIGRVNTDPDDTEFTVFCGGIILNLP